MREKLNSAVESSVQRSVSSDSDLGQLSKYGKPVDGLEARVRNLEKALSGMSNDIAQIQELMKESASSYQDILDKHDQLVVYIQSSMQYCENRESIDKLFTTDEENARETVKLSRMLEHLEERLVQVEELSKKKMPLDQGEQLLAVLKIHQGKLAEITKRLTDGKP